MGNLNNGTFIVGMEFGPVIVCDPNTLVVFNYQIANSGHQSPSETERTLGKITDELLKPENVQKAIESGETAGGFWGVIVAGGIIAIAEIIHLCLGTDCDGIVAIDQIAVTDATLKDWVSSSGSCTSPERHYHVKTPDLSPCHNSDYFVTWSVRRV